VQDIYSAFDRGDVTSILERLSPTVSWEYGETSSALPWLLPRRGREAVRGFFESLNELEICRFERTRFLQSEGTVVVLFDFEAIVKATGRRIVEEDEVHIWHFDAEGKIVRFRHRLDTHHHWLACGMMWGPC
jgi:ketosteroid isomerase-like protein